MSNISLFKDWIGKAVSEAEVRAATSRGLVPASGNPYKPYRWVKREETGQEQEGGENNDDNNTDIFTLEDVFINNDDNNIDDILSNISDINDKLDSGGGEGSYEIVENNNRIAYLFNGIKKFGREERKDFDSIDNINNTLNEIEEFSEYLTDIGKYVTENYDDIDDSFHDSIEQYMEIANNNYKIANDRKNEIDDMTFNFNSLFPYKDGLVQDINDGIKNVLSQPRTEDMENSLYQNNQTLRIARALSMAYDIDYDSEPTVENLSKDIEDLNFALGEMRLASMKFKNEKNKEMAEKSNYYLLDIHDVLAEKEDQFDNLKPENDEDEIEYRNDKNMEFFEDSFNATKEVSIADRMIKDIDSDDIDERNAVNFIKHSIMQLQEDFANGEMYKYRGIKDKEGNLQSFAHISNELYPTGREFHIDKIVTLPSLYRKKGDSPSGGLSAGSGVKLLTDVMSEFLDSDADYAVLEPLNEHVRRGYQRFGFTGSEWDLDMSATKEDVTKAFNRIRRYIQPRLAETGMEHVLDINKSFNNNMKGWQKKLIMKQMYDLGVGKSEWMPVYNIESSLFGKYILVRKGKDGKIRIDSTYMV